VKRTSLSHATGVNQPLRFFKRSVACGAIELERNQIKRLVLACRFDLAAIGFGNYRPPQSIVSLEGADCEPFVVCSTASMTWHGANGTGAALSPANACASPAAVGHAGRNKTHQPRLRTPCGHKTPGIGSVSDLTRKPLRRRGSW